MTNDQPITFDWLRRAFDEQLPAAPSAEPGLTYIEILTGTSRHADHAQENTPGGARCSCGLYAPGRIAEDPAA